LGEEVATEVRGARGRKTWLNAEVQLRGAVDNYFFLRKKNYTPSQGGGGGSVKLRQKSIEQEKRE